MSKENTDENNCSTQAEKIVKNEETLKASVNGDVQDKPETKETVVDEDVAKTEEKVQDTVKEHEKKSVEDDKKDNSEVQAENNSDEDDESDSEEELPPGLLERPIEILKDKRERKKTTRFTYDDAPTPSTEKKKLEIPDGRGIKLSQHPRVEWQLQRNKTEDLKIIHKLFFGVFGDAFTCKKNMRNFNGFPFEKDSAEFEKKEEYVGRFTLDNLKWALVVCDVENRKGKKEDLINNFLEWCLCPKPSGKDVPVKRKKKEKTKSSKKKHNTSQNVSNTSITSDDISDDDDEDQEVTPKKTKQSKSSRKSQTPKSSAKKKHVRKSTGSNKIAKIKIGSPKKSDNVDSDDSDAPLQKKKKLSPPTNAQIRKTVEKILKGANLEVTTMKAVCMKVYALYPDFDLSERKPFIKETVKSIIS